MSRKFDLIVDSCCDLSPALLAREGVRLVRFPYVLDGEERLDDLWAESDMHQFYEHMRAGSSPTTSGASASDLYHAFARAADDGRPALYLSFSSGLSSHFQNALRVVEGFRAERPQADVRIVDTKLASTGEALLVFAALERQERGDSIDEVEAWATEARGRVQIDFMVDDLECLRRGGRIPPIASKTGSLLGVKPLLTIDATGKLSLFGVSRGRKKALKTLVSRYAKSVDPAEAGFVCVGHADCEEDMRTLETMVRGAGFDPQFVEQPIGPVIGSHVGPGMVAFGYWGLEQRA